MATVTIGAIKYAGDFPAPLIEVYPEAASQSFIAGTPVVLASGKVTECEADVGSAQIFGFALNDATGTTDADCLVMVARPGDKFEANYLAADGSAGEATAQAIVGTKLPLIQKGTTGYFGIAKTGGANTACVTIVRLSPKDTLGDTGGRVIFTVNNPVISGPGLATIADPGDAGDVYAKAELQAAVNAVKAVIARLKTAGIIV